MSQREEEGAKVKETDALKTTKNRKRWSVPGATFLASVVPK